MFQRYGLNWPDFPLLVNAYAMSRDL